jgi:hypothetical protein
MGSARRSMSWMPRIQPRNWSSASSASGMPMNVDDQNTLNTSFT